MIAKHERNEFLVNDDIQKSADDAKVNPYKNNCGSKSRHNYTMQEKFNVVQLYYSLNPSKERSVAKIALLTGIPETTLNRWLKSQESRDIIASNYQLNRDSLRGGLKLKGVLQPGRFDTAEKALYAELAERRKRGQKCSSRWLSRRMILLCKDRYSDREMKAELELFRACSNWRRRFQPDLIFAKEKEQIRSQNRKMDSVSWVAKTISQNRCSTR